MEALEKDIERFLSVSSGDGSGYSYGNGGSYGYGYGSISGYEDGYSDGSGSGSGNGYGDGYSNGSGDGYSNCSGDDKGCGSGSGDGSGIKELNGRKVYYIDGVPTLILAVRGGIALGKTLGKDLNTRDCWIARRGDFFAHGETPRKAVEAVNAKWMENSPLEDRVEEFVRTHPSLTERYGDLFAWHHTLTGSCEFGRLRWCAGRGLKPTDSITLTEFFGWTNGEYGGDVIRMVAKEYGLNL